MTRGEDERDKKLHRNRAGRVKRMHVPEGWFDSKANERQTSSLGKEIYVEDKKKMKNSKTADRNFSTV